MGWFVVQERDRFTHGLTSSAALELQFPLNRHLLVVSKVHSLCKNVRSDHSVWTELDWPEYQKVGGFLGVSLGFPRAVGFSAVTSVTSQGELDERVGADVSGVPGRGGPHRQRLSPGDAGDVFTQAQVMRDPTRDPDP